MTAEERDAALGRIERTDNLADLAASDFLIEARTLYRVGPSCGPALRL
jgi:3-hydroxyacyl-CoA dehydrogenase